VNQCGNNKGRWGEGRENGSAASNSMSHMGKAHVHSIRQQRPGMRVAQSWGLA